MYMQQEQSRPRTPQRNETNPNNPLRTFSRSPYSRGKKNDDFINPSFVSHECFYEPHYEDKNKTLTPPLSPLDKKPKGYGNFDGYKIGDQTNHVKDRTKLSLKPGEVDPQVLNDHIRKENQRKRSDIDRDSVHTAITNQPKTRSDRFANTYKGGDKNDHPQNNHRQQNISSYEDHQTESDPRDQLNQQKQKQRGRNPSDQDRQGSVEKYYEPQYDVHGEPRVRANTRNGDSKPFQQTGHKNSKNDSYLPYPHNRRESDVNSIHWVRDQNALKHSYNRDPEMTNNPKFRNLPGGPLPQVSQTPSERSEVSQYDRRHPQNVRDYQDRSATPSRSTVSKGGERSRTPQRREHSIENLDDDNSSKYSRHSRQGGKENNKIHQNFDRNRTRDHENHLRTIVPGNQHRGHAEAHTPSKHSVHSQSQHSHSTYAGQELICDLCVNKKIIEEKELAKTQEQHKDKIYQQAMQDKVRQEREFELQEERRKKLNFMKEAKSHWDQTQTIKEERKRMDRMNQDVQNTLLFEDDARFERDRYELEKKKAKLRNDLKTQIKEKRMEHRRSKDIENRERTQVLTGYPIGGNYVDRYQKLKRNHIDELRDQIDDKRRKAEEEKKVKKDRKFNNFRSTKFFKSSMKRI